MESVNKARIGYIGYSAALFALGAVLMFFPEMSAVTVCRILGGILLLCGILRLCAYFVNDTYGLAFQFDFALGIFTALIGILLLVRSRAMISCVNVAFGIFILADGVFKLQTAREARQFGLRRWALILVPAAITVLVGLILMLDSFGSIMAVTSIFGIALMADGLQNLLTALLAIRLVKRSKRVNAEFTEK